MSGEWRGRRRAVGLAVLFLLIAAGFIPVPYYVIRPGTAVPVRQLVDVRGGDVREKGVFLLTTVAVSEGNGWWYLYARVVPGNELVPRERMLGPGENPETYRKRQEEVMRLSQQNAMIAAYRHAGRPVRVTFGGVKVLQTLPGMPAARELVPGDRIVAVDGYPVQSVGQLLRMLREKREGETVHLSLWRKGRRLERTVSLARLPASGGRRVGIGVVPVTVRRVETDPPVRVRADHIGGPSAGLMFALEMLNQLTPEDLTRGRKVAGTGTISTDGEVGQIGGVEHKVVAADREGADLFFVPADTHPGDSNQSKAEATARSIGTRMQIVPVRTLEEAVRYLHQIGAVQSREDRTLTRPPKLAYNEPVLMAQAGAM